MMSPTNGDVMARIFDQERLRSELEKRDHDARWLAAQTRAKPGTVAGWLAGTSSPRMSSIVLIAMIFKMKPEDFILEDED
jgi:hypothetical protein